MDPAEDPLERVRAAARLARLAIDEAEAARLAPQFGAILDAFSALAQVPVEALEPLLGPHPPEDALREDEPLPGLDRAVLLANAPEVEQGHYRVPRAIG